ncbi:MAG: TonB family protein [Cyanobacteria bacterium P01_F01_bin.143]
MTISAESSQQDQVVSKIDENQFRRNPIPLFVLASVLVHVIGLGLFAVIERSRPKVQLIPDKAPVDFIVVPPEESAASTKIKPLPPEEIPTNRVIEPEKTVVQPKTRSQTVVVPKAIKEDSEPKPLKPEKTVVKQETRSQAAAVPEPIVESLPKETKLPKKLTEEKITKSEPTSNNTPITPITENPNSAPTTPSTTGAASLLGGNLKKSFDDDGGNSFFNLDNNVSQQAYNPALDAQQRLDMRNYFSKVRRRVKRNWNPQYSTKDHNTVLSFSIQRNGQITALKIRKTSGSSARDREALNAVQNSGPFDPLPANFPLEMLKVEFNFNIYTY